MEACRVATQMKSGKFTVRTIDAEEAAPSELITRDVSQLFLEMFSTDKESLFIAKHIDSNCLETDEKNLFLLPSGSIPSNPSELLGSSYASYLINLLIRRYDVLVIDSSPIVVASDALLLAALTDGVVLVIEVGKTNRNIIKDAYSQLQKTKANVLGVLLNKAQAVDRSYYKYYQAYYGE